MRSRLRSGPAGRWSGAPGGGWPAIGPSVGRSRACEARWNPQGEVFYRPWLRTKLRGADSRRGARGPGSSVSWGEQRQCWVGRVWGELTPRCRCAAWFTVAMTVSCGLTTRHLHSGLLPNQGSNCSVDFLKLKFVSFCEDGGAAHRDRRCVLVFQGASRRTPSALLGQSRARCRVDLVPQRGAAAARSLQGARGRAEAGALPPRGPVPSPRWLTHSRCPPCGPSRGACLCECRFWTPVLGGGGGSVPWRRNRGWESPDRSVTTMEPKGLSRRLFPWSTGACGRACASPAAATPDPPSARLRAPGGGVGLQAALLLEFSFSRCFGSLVSSRVLASSVVHLTSLTQNEMLESMIGTGKTLPAIMSRPRESPLLGFPSPHLVT